MTFEEARNGLRFERRARTTAKVVRYVIEQRHVDPANLAEQVGVELDTIEAARAGTHPLEPRQLSKVAKAANMLPGDLLLAARPPQLDHSEAWVREHEQLRIEALRKCDDFTLRLRERRQRERGGDSSAA
jgi:hypothetical protein